MEYQKYNTPLKAFATIYRSEKYSKIINWFWAMAIFIVVIFFLPWTQNIRGRGMVTTIRQEQRPQELNTVIGGKIAKWWVKEGDLVKKGDTIMLLSEIKAEYLDPKLVSRTQDQVNAKKEIINFYESKVLSASEQIWALQNAKKYKIEQLKNKLLQMDNKIQGEQADVVALTNECDLLKDQYERQQKMFDDGLVSQTQLQQRNAAYQNALAKKTSAINKLAQSKQELININIEQNSVEQEYAEKISKTQADRFQSMGQIADGQGDLAKLENQTDNYTIRNDMYVILAPQDGQIVQANKTGIGEILKEGEKIAVIVPQQIDFAVEMFVRPVDLPLIKVNQKVRFMFDGFPALVFSGWPDNSYGTFGGKVYAIENTVSTSGYFRVLVIEDSTDKKWPPTLKNGVGAQGIALLKDVPIWYELWRNINGFPPDYYIVNDDESKTKK